ncbi:MAG: hypothetical protein LBH08_02270 [Puniceicoccales bacterium]|nr:hypothetical protein [Puniceicoccales bacterium]
METNKSKKIGHAAMCVSMLYMGTFAAEGAMAASRNPREMFMRGESARSAVASANRRSSRANTSKMSLANAQNGTSSKGGGQDERSEERARLHRNLIEMDAERVGVRVTEREREVLNQKNSELYERSLSQRDFENGMRIKKAVEKNGGKVILTKTGKEIYRRFGQWETNEKKRYDRERTMLGLRLFVAMNTPEGRERMAEVVRTVLGAEITALKTKTQEELNGVRREVKEARVVAGNAQTAADKAQTAAGKAQEEAVKIQKEVAAAKPVSIKPDDSKGKSVKELEEAQRKVHNIGVEHANEELERRVEKFVNDLACSIGRDDSTIRDSLSGREAELILDLTFANEQNRREKMGEEVNYIKGLLVDLEEINRSKKLCEEKDRSAHDLADVRRQAKEKYLAIESKLEALNAVLARTDDGSSKEGVQRDIGGTSLELNAARKNLEKCEQDCKKAQKDVCEAWKGHFANRDTTLVKIGKYLNDMKGMSLEDLRRMRGLPPQQTNASQPFQTASRPKGTQYHRQNCACENISQEGKVRQERDKFLDAQEKAWAENDEAQKCQKIAEAIEAKIKYLQSLFKGVKEKASLCVKWKKYAEDLGRDFASMSTMGVVFQGDKDDQVLQVRQAEDEADRLQREIDLFPLLLNSLSVEKDYALCEKELVVAERAHRGNPSDATKAECGNKAKKLKDRKDKLTKADYELVEKAKELVKQEEANIEGKITEGERRIAECKQQIENAQSTVDTETGNVRTVQGDVDNAQGELNQANADISAVTVRFRQAEAAIRQSATEAQEAQTRVQQVPADQSVPRALEVAAREAAAREAADRAAADRAAADLNNNDLYDSQSLRETRLNGARGRLADAQQVLETAQRSLADAQSKLAETEAALAREKAGRSKTQSLREQLERDSKALSEKIQRSQATEA